VPSGECRFFDCRLLIEIWELPVGLTVADWMVRLRIGLADCSIAIDIPIGSRQSQSSTTNLNRQSTIEKSAFGTRHSPIEY
jgi:hypothetical protein